jgi:hypothetical protein
LNITLKKILFLFLIPCLSCDTGNLTVLADLPSTLNEVSGIEIDSKRDLIWMLNDSGNPSKIYSLDINGNIVKTLKINAKNNDWEDFTSDAEGNIYIGDFGNNSNKRKNLAVLKVSKDSLDNSKKIDVEHISFYYPNQKKFPPKRKQRHFDCEAFFYYNGSLYLFTKSREKGNFGKTNLYKIPASQGNHKAQFIGSFKTCNDLPCWVTSADISDDGKQIALLTLNAVWIFSDYKNDNFFNGKVIKYDFDFESQKESVCFKNKNTLYITDENVLGKGGNLYEFTLK